MSTPELKKHDNGVYYVHWTDGRRSKRVSTREVSLAAAQRFLGTFLLMDRSDDTRQTTDALVTISEAWGAYETAQIRKRAVAAARNRSIGRHLCAAFGDLPVASLRQSHVDRYVSNRAAAEATICLELRKLTACINHAVKAKLMPASDKPDFESPDAPEPRDRWLREDEIRRVHAAAEEMRRGPRLSRAERFIWLAMETAARKRVIETLTWAQVDFETGVIHYRKAGDKLTKKKRPSVPISKALFPILERAYAERTSDLVLDTETAVSELIETVGKRAGVAGLTPHVFRHTAATWMARRGVPLWKIAGVLGNTMLMVEKVYAKHCPEGLADAVEQISGGFVQRSVGAPTMGVAPRLSVPSARHVSDNRTSIAAEPAK